MVLKLSENISTRDLHVSEIKALSLNLEIFIMKSDVEAVKNHFASGLPCRLHNWKKPSATANKQKASKYDNVSNYQINQDNLYYLNGKI